MNYVPIFFIKQFKDKMIQKYGNLEINYAFVDISSSLLRGIDIDIDTSDNMVIDMRIIGLPDLVHKAKQTAQTLIDTGIKYKEIPAHISLTTFFIKKEAELELWLKENQLNCLIEVKHEFSRDTNQIVTLYSSTLNDMAACEEAIDQSLIIIDIDLTDLISNGFQLDKFKKSIEKKSITVYIEKINTMKLVGFKNSVLNVYSSIFTDIIFSK